MFLFAFVIIVTVKVSAQAEPQSEKRVINLGSSNSSYKIEETNFQDKPGLGDYWGKTFYIPYYFPLHQGDTWNYKVTEESEGETEESGGRIEIDGTEIVNGIETKKRYELLDPGYQDENYYKCVAQNSEGFVWYKKADNNKWRTLENFSYDSSDKFFTPPYVYLPLKMRIGQSSTSYWLDTRPYGAPSTTICGRTIELEGIETVIVPAGKFKGCLKIKYCQFDHEENPGDHEVYKGWIWLARGVGIVKTVEYGAEYLPDEQKTDTWTDTTELTSYKINEVWKRKKERRKLPCNIGTPTTQK